MEESLSPILECLSRDLDDARNSVLFYGEPKLTKRILDKVYSLAKEKKELLCSFHDASLIKHPLDFFEPVLRLKYGDEYESLIKQSWFKDLMASNDGRGIFQLAGLCGREENSENPNARRLPVFFIDGIEELFFNMDYGHIDKEEIEQILNSWDKGFGTALRSNLHQTHNGVVYGRVRNLDGIEYGATLGSYHYLFYAGNFRPFTLP